MILVTPGWAASVSRWRTWPGAPEADRSSGMAWSFTSTSDQASPVRWRVLPGETGGGDGGV